MKRCIFTAVAASILFFGFSEAAVRGKLQRRNSVTKFEVLFQKPAKEEMIEYSFDSLSKLPEDSLSFTKPMALFSFNLFKKLESCFGSYKDARLYGNATVIDVSCPRIIEFARQKTENTSKSVTIDEVSQKRGEKLNLADLKAIVDYFGNVNSAQDYNLSGLKHEQIRKLCKICIENGQLFNVLKDSSPDCEAIIENPEKEFECLLKRAMENYTGFQRILSMLIVSVLNNIDDDSFSDIQKIDIAMSAKASTIQAPSFYKSVVAEKTHIVVLAKGELAAVAMHELSHASHDMLMRYFESYWGANSLVIDSVLRGNDILKIGFKESFFPMLSDAKLAAPVAEIKKSVRFGIMKYFKKSALFKKLESKGFGRLLEGVNRDEKLAKAAYVYSLCNIESSGGIYGSSHIWTNPEEMLTLFGLVPFNFGGAFVVLVDRQNESAFEARAGRNYYLFHRREIPGVFQDNLKNTLKMAGVRLKKDITVGKGAFTSDYDNFKRLSKEREETAVITREWFTTVKSGSLLEMKGALQRKGKNYINIQNEEGKTALISVMEEAESADDDTKRVVLYDKAKFLLENAACLDAADNNGFYALDYAVNCALNGNDAMLKLVLDAYKSANIHIPAVSREYMHEQGLDSPL